MNDAEVLRSLLDHLRRRQGWCPYCGHSDEHHAPGCVLHGRWFAREVYPDEQVDRLRQAYREHVELEGN